MHFLEHHLSQQKTILGISVRTSPETAALHIGSLWQQFMQDPFLGRIRAITPEIYCAYFEYESDHQGAYTTLLGYEVAQDHPVPQGMQTITLLTGRYATFPVEGKTGTIIYEAWTHINGSFLFLRKRAYRVDFERYLSVTRDHLQAEISVGIL